MDHFNVTPGDRPFKLRLADKAWEQGCPVATLEWLGRGVSGSTELVQAVMPNTPPVVSCLTVTAGKADRLEHLKRTISDFCLQSHQQKILQIFVNGLKQDQDIISQYADDLGRNDIHVTPVTGDYTLGELRNISFASASGDIIAQWDDDDRHHPRALEEQLSYLASGGYDAVYLQDLFQYFPLSRSIFWTNWRSTEISGHPGTLMMKRSLDVAYPTEGPEALLGEDTAVARRLLSMGNVGFLSGAPHLFIYTSHGANTYGEDHHAMLAARLSISQGLLKRREDDIRRNLKDLDFGADDLMLVGNNGAAFLL